MWLRSEVNQANACSEGSVTGQALMVSLEWGKELALDLCSLCSLCAPVTKWLLGLQEIAAEFSSNKNLSNSLCCQFLSEVWVRAQFYERKLAIALVSQQKRYFKNILSDALSTSPIHCLRLVSLFTCPLKGWKTKLISVELELWAHKAKTNIAVFSIWCSNDYANSLPSHHHHLMSSFPGLYELHRTG